MFEGWCLKCYAAFKKKAWLGERLKYSQISAPLSNKVPECCAGSLLACREDAGRLSLMCLWKCLLRQPCLVKHLPLVFECEDSRHVYTGDSGIASHWNITVSRIKSNWQQQVLLEYKRYIWFPIFWTVVSLWEDVLYILWQLSFLEPFVSDTVSLLWYPASDGSP